MRTSRYAIAAAAAALAAGCGPAADKGANSNATDPSQAKAPPVVPAPEAPLDREAILLAVVRAASAAAAGTSDPAAQRELDGKRFELKLSFACPTTLPDAQQAAEGRGQRKAGVRLSARPDVSLDDPLIRAVVDVAAFEAVEGFSIERPWLLRSRCPPAPPTPQADQEKTEQETERDRGGAAPSTDATPTSHPQRVAIAQFFTSTDTRAGRRSKRPFEAVVTEEQARAIEGTGFNLVLAGRLRALPGGQVIACSAAEPALPPNCLISADFDQVRMEHPETGAVFARWAD